MATYEMTGEGLRQESEAARKGGWRWPGVGVLGLALLLAGLGVFWYLRAPGANSAEVAFARDMSAHHEQAVEMAVIVRDRSADEELRIFTLDILLTQQAQIGQMQGWLAVWGQPLSGPEAPMAGHGEAMGMASLEEVQALSTLPVAEAEASFLRLMIRHHQGGVVMAEQALEATQRPEVVRLAEAIVQGQRSEIEYMAGLLAERGAAPAEPLAPPSDGHDAHP